MPPRGRQAASRREQPLLSNEAARFQSLVIDLGKRAAMDGTLKAAPATVVDELERLFVSMGLQRSLGVSSMLDWHGTPEFWAAVFLVHGYALRDYSALYEEMQQVQEQRQAQRGGATREGGWEGSDSPEWQQLTQSMRRARAGICSFQYALASSDALSRKSPGHERRVLALLRSDTFKSYSAVFDAVARGRLSGTFAYDVSTILATMLSLLPECMGVYKAPCNSGDDYDLQLYGAFVKAAADSHVLDHACRAALWLADFVGGEQAACTAGGAAAQEQEAHHEIGTATLRPVDLGQREKKMGSICDRLRSMRKDINKVLSTLLGPLLGQQQSLGALHPRPLAAPRTGTDPALLALLPAVRGLLSGTGVQVWAAKQLLDVANVAQEEVLGGTELGSSVCKMFGLTAPDPYLGLPSTARMQPHMFTATADHPLKKPDTATTIELLRGAMSVSSSTWQVTISGPVGAAAAAPGALSNGSATTGGGRSVGGGSASASGSAAAGSGGVAAAAAAPTYRLPETIPFSAAQVCSMVSTALQRVLMPGWSAARSDQGEIVQALLLLSRLAQELRARQAQRVLEGIWGMINGWLQSLPVDALTPARQVLQQLGALLLHECPGEGELAQAAARQGGHPEPNDCPLALHAAEGFLILVHDVSVEWLGQPLALHGALFGRLIADMVNALLRQSCVLPVLVVHQPSPSLLDLVVTLRAMCNALRRKGMVAEAVALQTVLLHLAEQLAAVWMRPLPEGMRSGSSSQGAGSGAAAGAGCLPGQPIPDALAAAIDRTAAALLTKASREQVPKQRLRRMWLAAHGRPNKAAILPAPVSVVFIMAQLLSLLSGLRKQRLWEADVPKDSILALTRVYMAVALQALLASESAPARSGLLTASEARAESWRAMLLAEEGAAVAWAASALYAAVRRQWPEGQEAALDLLEVLVLLLPAEDLRSHVGYYKDESATWPPSGPALPLALGQGWLAQQGREKLAAVMNWRQTSRGGLVLSLAAPAHLSDMIAKPHITALPQLPCPADAAAAVAAMTGIWPCSAADCSRLQESGREPIATQLCSRCRAARYCCAECQKAHWRAGHKTQCARQGAIWAALNTAPAPLHP